jgi:hypothetical protein
MRRPWPTGGCRAKNKETKNERRPDIKLFQSFNFERFVLLSMYSKHHMQLNKFFLHFRENANYTPVTYTSQASIDIKHCTG